MVTYFLIDGVLPVAVQGPAPPGAGNLVAWGYEDKNPCCDQGPCTDASVGLEMCCA